MANRRLRKKIAFSAYLHHSDYLHESGTEQGRRGDRLSKSLDWVRKSAIAIILRTTRIFVTKIGDTILIYMVSLIVN